MILRPHFRLAALALLFLLTTTVSLPAQMPEGKDGKQDGKKELTEVERKALVAETARWGKETSALRKAGNLEEAISAAKKMLAAELKVYGELHEDPINSLEQIGQLQRQLERFDDAKRTCQRVLQLQTKRFGKEAWQATDARLGVEMVEILEKLTAEQRKELREAGQIAVRGVAERGKGNYVAATHSGERVVDIKKRLLGEAHPSYALSLSDLATQHVSNGEYARSEHLFIIALAVQKKALGENHPDYVSSLQNLAFLYRSMSEYAKAELLFKQVIETQKIALGENHRDYAIALSNFASLYRLMGEYRKAEPMFKQALDILKEVMGEVHLDYAISLNNLALLYKSMGEHAKAEPLYIQATAIAKKVLGDAHPQYASGLDNLAGLYLALDNDAKAEPLLVQALAIRKMALGEAHPSYATTLNNLATLYRSMGEYAKAEPLYIQALAIMKNALGEAHPNYASTLCNLALLHTSTLEYAKAEPLLIKALAIRKKALSESHPDYARNLDNLALLYTSTGEYAKAEPLYIQALAIMKNATREAHPDYAACLDNLALLYTSTGEYAKAEPLSLKAVGLIVTQLERTSEIQNEAGQLASVRANSLFWQNMLVGTAKSASTSIYDPLFRIRGAITSRQMFLRTVRQSSPVTQPLVEELQQTSREMSRLVNSSPNPNAKVSLPQRLEELTARYEQLQKDLAAKSDAYAMYQKKQKATPADLQKLLPDDAVLIDFVAYKDQLCAFVIGKKSIARVELGAMKPIAGAIDRFRDQLDRVEPLTGKPDDPALVLRETLWKPLTAAVGKAKMVLVCPDGPLCRLPFAALPSADGRKYLIEELTLVTMPVPQQLVELMAPRPDRKGEPSLFTMGDVDFDGGAAVAVAKDPESPTRRKRASGEAGWGQLPGTRDEVAAIADSFKAASPNGKLASLRGKEATERNLRTQMGQYEFVHLATHGYFSPKELTAKLKPTKQEEDAARGFSSDRPRAPSLNPALMSGIVCAGANKPTAESDGVLTALDISEMDLSKVEMAILSACETGLGETAGGEGVFGLQRAFQLAGARTTVTSLWKIDDSASQKLMARFYDNRLRRKLGTAESLREAQLWMLKEGVTLGLLRGKDQKALTVVPPAKGDTPPRFWAAFSLAGDWR